MPACSWLAWTISGNGQTRRFDVAEAFQHLGAEGDADAGPLQQAGGHVLVARQPEGQRGRAGDREAHHPHQGRQPHFVERPVDHVVVLVEDHVGGQPPQFPLEGEQVPGQRHDRDLIADVPQGTGHVADHRTQVGRAAAVFRVVRRAFPIAVVHQSDMQPPPGSPNLLRHH